MHWLIANSRHFAAPVVFFAGLLCVFTGSRARKYRRLGQPDPWSTPLRIALIVVIVLSGLLLAIVPTR